MKLGHARFVAESLCLGMSAFCARPPEILGSVRRGKAEVKDLEILAIPRWEEVADNSALFGEPRCVNTLHAWAMRERPEGTLRWIKPGTSDLVDWQPKPEGKYWRAWVQAWDFPACVLDLFLCTAANYGAIQLIRTGSADFSRAVMGYANEHTEYKFQGGGIWRGGESIAVADEREVFELLGLHYVEPAERVDGRSIRRI